MDITRLWQKGILIIGLSSFSISTEVIAQIQPDQSLKNESSTVVPAIVHQFPATRIEGGAIRGVNLFHSFQEFNVLELQRVYFANPQGITNIFSRVTGGNPSQILGTLGVEGTANLFFLNPNGILFGKNAVLDIQGSFFATTASAFTFPNGEQFSATQPEAAPLLTLNIKPGLQYGNTPPETIENLGTLKVGQDLTLAGENVTLQGELHSGGNLTLQAIDTLKIRDTATTPFIALSQGEIIIQGDQLVDIYTLNHPQSGFYSGNNLTLRSQNPVSADAHFWSNGNMRIEKLNGTLNHWISEYDPVIISAGDVEWDGYNGTSLHILAGGKVTVTGTITITGAGTVDDTISPSSSNLFFQELANTFTLPDGTVMDGYQKPVLDIRSGIDWSTFSGNADPYFKTYNGQTSPIPINLKFLPSVTSSDISIQNVAINVDHGVVSLTNQYFANPTLSGNITANRIHTIAPKNSGSIFISSQGNVTLSDTVDTGSLAGNGGSVIISANNNINTKNILTSSSNGQGGNIYLQSKNAGIDTTKIFIDARSINNKAGNIEIQAKGNLALGRIAADGQLGGEIALTSTDGNITVQEQIISSASVSKSSTATGGTISLKANEILIEKSLIYTNTATDSTAKAGNIEIETNKIDIIGKNISVKLGGFMTQTNGAGDAGNISIKTGSVGSVLIQDGAEVRTSTINSGNAGNIDIITGNLTIKNDENLSENSGLYSNTVYKGASKTGNAGNININAKTVDLITGYIFANTDSGNTSAILGNAGNLTVKADTLSLRNGAIATVNSSSNGNAGKITLNTRQTEVVGENVKGVASTFVFDSFKTGSPGVFEFNGDILSVREGGLISGSSQQGTISNNPGILRINADQLVEIKGRGSNNPSGIVLNTSGKTNAGDMQFNTQKLQIENGGILSAQTIATGNSGTLVVNAEDILVSGYNQNPSTIIFNSQGSGNAGQLLLNSNNITVNNGGQIMAKTNATGKGGTLQINAAQAVTVSGTNSQIDFSSSGTSQAGGIQIKTPQLSVSNNGQISVNGTGTGNAGSLEVNSSNVTISQGGKVSGNTQSSGGGNLIFNNLSNLTLQGNGEISTSTIDGKGGTIFIQSNRVNLNQNSRISARATGQGDGGNINILMGDLILENGSQIAVDSQGIGSAGNINIQGNDIFMQNGARLQATTISGLGGNININVAKSIQLRYNSDILTRAEGSGNGGNMNLNADLFIFAILPENSDIIASSKTGTGGNINVSATAIFGFILYKKVDTPESDFTASSEFGIDGIVDINTRDLQATPLPENPGLPVTAEGCDGRMRIDNQNFIGSRFVNTHYGGISPNMLDTVGSITGVLPRIILKQDHTELNSSNFEAEYDRNSQALRQVSISFRSCDKALF